MPTGVNADPVYIEGLVTPGNLASFADAKTLQDSGISSALQISVARVTVTAAQIIAGSFVTIVPAKGAGKYIVPLFYILNYKSGGTPFAASAKALSLVAGGHDWGAVDAVGFIDTAADAVTTSFSGSSSTALPPVASNWSEGSGNSPVLESSIDNAPLRFIADAGITAGNGTVDVIVWYSVVTKA